MMNQTQNSNEMPTDGATESPEMGSPIDGIISTVDSYMKDPKMVTPETLAELKSELMDLKSFLDDEETQSGESMDTSNGGVGSMINTMRGGK